MTVTYVVSPEAMEAYLLTIQVLIAMAVIPLGLLLAYYGTAIIKQISNEIDEQN